MTLLKETLLKYKVRNFTKISNSSMEQHFISENILDIILFYYNIYIIIDYCSVLDVCSC